MKKGVLFLIVCYQKTLSPDKGIIRFLLPIRGACVMYPTCSEYAYKTIEKNGLFIGSYRTFFRILRCHPYQKRLIDPP